MTVLPAKKLKIFSCGSEEEFGHIPSWLLERLTATTGFSPYLTKCFAKFSARYSKLTGHRNPPECEPESDVINSLLRDIRNGDKDLYLPLDTFNSLKAWEWSGAHAEARDHYFHTLNNLLLGYVLLGETLRDITAEGPDEFVVDPTGKSKLKSWEALWFLTCLNHDPGYKGEKFWPAVYANFGLRRTKVPPKPIPAEIATDLVDAWDTDLREARTELLDLYNRVVKLWSPPRFAAKMRAPFDAALRLAYFDGVRSSHSLLSGLNLIQDCLADPGQRRKPDAQRSRALAACEIAALSMLFHDQRCRSLLQNNGVPPIPFERLPYASALIFVDALQDDRRDVGQLAFPKHEVLSGLEIASNGARIAASVCLRELPVRFWPGKLAEYQSATLWLNASSAVTFVVNYSPNLLV